MENKQFYRIGKNEDTKTTEVSEVNYYNGVYCITSVVILNNVSLRVAHNVPESFMNEFINSTNETDKGVFFASISTYNEHLLKANKISQDTYDSLT
jgi:hypothetical protein